MALYVLRFTFYGAMAIDDIMSDTAPESGTSGEQHPSWRRWARAALPHLLTAVLAIAVSLAAQALLVRPAEPTVIVPTSAPPSAPPAPTLAATPASTAPAPAPDIVRQELIDLRAEDDRLWAAVYLTKAISQVSDAESQMRANDLGNVAQSLVAMDGSLELAYERADESIKSPIAEMRRAAGALHDDLYVRPEGMDTRLAVLRQTILALVGERR
jgi:hypothetical protein